MNNDDLGRQWQTAVRDLGHPNPTLAGDGYNPAPVEILVSEDGMQYVKTVPVDYYNSVETKIPQGPPLESHRQRLHTWTEFVADTNGGTDMSRTLLVRTVYVNENTDFDGGVNPQNLNTSFRIVEEAGKGWAYFDGIHDDTAVWGSGALTEMAPSSLPAGGTNYLPAKVTENWVGIYFDDNGVPVDDRYGVSVASPSASWLIKWRADRLEDAFYPPEYQDGQIFLLGYDRFRMRTHNADASGIARERQIREGYSLVHFGSISEARSEFMRWRTTTSGADTWDFDGDELGQLHRNAIAYPALDPDGGQCVEVQTPAGSRSFSEIAIPRRKWSYGVYSVRVRWPSGPGILNLDGGLGLAIAKPAESNPRVSGNEYAGGGYVVCLERKGNSTVNARVRVYDSALPSSAQVKDVSLSSIYPTDWNEMRIDYEPNRLKVTINPNHPVAPGVVEWVIADNPAAGQLQRWGEGAVGLIQDRPVPNDRAVVGWFDDLSITPTVGVTAAPPSPVASASVAPSEGKLRIDWTPPTPATDIKWYRVVRRVGSSGPAHWRDGMPVYEGFRTNYTDYDVEPGQMYSYGVFTENFQGLHSTPVDATGVAPTGATAPTASFIHNHPSVESGPVYLYLEGTSKGDVTHREWTVDGVVLRDDSVEVRHKVLFNGWYRVELRVEDSNGNVSKESRWVEVGGADLASEAVSALVASGTSQPSEGWSHWVNPVGQDQLAPLTPNLTLSNQRVGWDSAGITPQGDVRVEETGSGSLFMRPRLGYEAIQTWRPIDSALPSAPVYRVSVESDIRLTNPGGVGEVEVQIRVRRADGTLDVSAPSVSYSGSSFSPDRYVATLRKRDRIEFVVRSGASDFGDELIWDKSLRAHATQLYAAPVTSDLSVTYPVLSGQSEIPGRVRFFDGSQGVTPGVTTVQYSLLENRINPGEPRYWATREVPPGTPFQFTYAFNGQYWARLEVRTGARTVFEEALVEVSNAPQGFGQETLSLGPLLADFSATDREVELGDEVQFLNYSNWLPADYDAQAAAQNISFSWDLDEGFTSTDLAPTVTYANPGLKTITLTYTRDVVPPGSSVAVPQTVSSTKEGFIDVR